MDQDKHNKFPPVRSYINTLGESFFGAHVKCSSEDDNAKANMIFIPKGDRISPSDKHV